MGAALVHDGVEGRIVVPDEAVPVYEASGWHREDGRPAGQAGPARTEPYAEGDPAETETAVIYHPELGRATSVPAGSVAHYRPSGWLLLAEWEASQAAAAAGDKQERRARRRADRADAGEAAGDGDNTEES